MVLEMKDIINLDGNLVKECPDCDTIIILSNEYRDVKIGCFRCNLVLDDVLKG